MFSLITTLDGAFAATAASARQRTGCPRRPAMVLSGSAGTPQHPHSVGVCHDKGRGRSESGSGKWARTIGGQTSWPRGREGREDDVTDIESQPWPRRPSLLLPPTATTVAAALAPPPET